MLSVVVPSYNVQAYLRECLDSLLRQSFTDIEVIAVDDCSSDRSGEILDSYARHDPRVRVLHLEHNVGLGRARNAGLAAATGEYVWFVDSDDWVADGALAAITTRLQSTRPDVLVIDHARSYWDLRTERNVRHDVLTAAPEVFRAMEYPDIFQLFPSAWNKIVRREFLATLDVGFPTGYYEDLPFTYPLLAAAERISALDQVCLHYRQRRGSILLSSGARHLDLLDQYQLTFQRLAQLGDGAAELIPAIYRQMAGHLFTVIGSGRLSGEHQREYFRRASELARRLRPAGHPAPGGLDGVRYRVLISGSWPLARVLRGTYRLARHLGAGIGRGGRATAAKLGTLARLGRIWALRRYYRVQTRLPVDENLAIYCAYWGRGYSCSPKAIYEKARELAPSVRGVWVVTEEGAATMPPGVDYVIEGTAPFFRALARAKYLVNNNNFADYYVKRSGSVFVQTHHGTPLKSMGIDQQRYPLTTNMRFRKLLKRCDNWDYNISSNLYSTNIWQKAYPCDFVTLEYGYPRNDVLVNATRERIAELRAQLGIAPGERVILYAPTHREYHTGYQALLDPYEFVRALGPGNRLLVRAHYFYEGESGLPDLPEQILDMSAYPVVEDLYLVADVLITDYSSVMFDYAILDRPIVIYAPDWDAYRRTRGTYFDLSAEPPGLFTSNDQELIDAFRTGAIDSTVTRKLRAAFRERFCGFDDGNAAERLVRRVMLGETPALAAGALPAGKRQTVDAQDALARS